MWIQILAVVVAWCALSVVFGALFSIVVGRANRRAEADWEKIRRREAERG